MSYNRSAKGLSWGEGFPLSLLYLRLFQRYGHRFWWPGTTPFDIAVGAVLVQNSPWRRVEQIFRLNPWLCDRETVQKIGTDTLAETIWPVGSRFRKARALQALAEIFPHLQNLPDKEARKALLRIHGIGPETADSILLYAFQRPVFVVDAYTRRILARLWDNPNFTKVSYDDLRQWLEVRLPREVAWYQDAHAQFVIHAQTVCRIRPQCVRCILQSICLYGRKQGWER